MKTAILVPCYNEEATIARVIDDFKPFGDVYVGDNNSTDSTAEIAREHGAMVIPYIQQGKGFVCRNLFRDVEADFYVIVDGDATYLAKDLQYLGREVFEGKADMAIGDRLSGKYFTENKRKFHNGGNKMVRFLINRIFKSKVNDIMTGYRVFSRRFVKSFPVLSGGFEIETEMTIHALDKRFAIVEKTIEYQDRPAGSESKLSTIRDGIKVIKTILKLYKNYRPFSFFSRIAVVIGLVATAWVTPIIIHYFQTGVVPKFPSLIVIQSIYLAALIVFAIGLILQTIKHYNDYSYELFVNTLLEKRSDRNA